MLLPLIPVSFVARLADKCAFTREGNGTEEMLTPATVTPLQNGATFTAKCRWPNFANASGVFNHTTRACAN